MDQVYDSILRWPVVILVVAAVALFISRRQTKLNLPIVEVREGKNGSDTLMDARAQYPEKPFQLRMKENWIILPHSMVDEIKVVPAEKLSFMKVNYVRLEGRYTGIGAYEHHEGVAAIRNDLTRNISKVLSELQDEVSFALDKQVGDRPQWKEMWVFGDILQVVARLSARTFVGLPLCRDDEWVNTTINMTVDLVNGVNAIKKYPEWIRPVTAPFLPEVRRIKHNTATLQDKIRHQVEAVVRAHQLTGRKPTAADVSDDDITDENHNLVHWVIRNFKDPSKVTAKEIGVIEEGVAFAAIHTTSMALTHAIFDLAAYPYIVKELRDEITTVIAEENHPDQMLRKTSIPKLKKLDSFIKESQRMNPPGMISMSRLVIARNGLTLSDGIKLPYGTMVGFAHPFYTTATKYPDTILTATSQPPLTQFYPWRFSDIRTTKPGEENRHLFVSSDANDITFGVGRHACPGRFFASNEIKVVLAELLKRYEIGLGPEGQGEGAEYPRPKLIEHDTFYAPDPYAKVYVRNRKV